MDRSSEQRDSARQAIEDPAPQRREQGGRVDVTRFWKQGNVDHNKIPALTELGLDSYRDRAREEVRVTCAN
jgi:hypothetical protein